MNDKLDLLKSRIIARIETINHQDKGNNPEAHARYRGIVAGLQTVLDWIRMSENGGMK